MNATPPTRMWRIATRLGALRLAALGLAALGLVACGGKPATDPRVELRELVTELGLAPIAQPPPQDPAKVELGRALFFDPILSGNRDVACATCHHPARGTSDGRSMSVGTQARLLNGARVPGPDHTFVPRNAVALWDVGHSELSVAFWDGRLARREDNRIVLYDTGYALSDDLRLVVSDVIDTLPAAVALFPVLDRDEMRGEWGETDVDGQPNELALIIDADFDRIWIALMDRLRAVDEYRALFLAAYPDIPLADLQFAHAANALGAFVTEAFSSTRATAAGASSRTPWDDFLYGDDRVLNEAQARGASLFYGRAGCAHCHQDTLMSDEKAHNFGVRPMGTGPKHDHEHVDLGAALTTHGGDSQRYAFRTPRLRNVAVSGPWMHNGLYTDLSAVIRHKSDPLTGLHDYDTAQLAPEFQGQVHRHPDVIADVQATIPDELQQGVSLSNSEIADLVAFLGALTSPHAATLTDLIPDGVPSGLRLVDP